jgi:hypothetical protein
MLPEEADKTSWDNQWIKAAPLYARAAQFFRSRTRPLKTPYADVNQLIPRVEPDGISNMLLELRQDQRLPAGTDPETRLRILVIEGMIETNCNASIARTIWVQARSLAALQRDLPLVVHFFDEQRITALPLSKISGLPRSWWREPG